MYVSVFVCMVNIQYIVLQIDNMGDGDVFVFARKYLNLNFIKSIPTRISPTCSESSIIHRDWSEFVSTLVDFTTYGEGMLPLQDYQSVLILLSSAIATFIQIQIRLLQSYL